MENKNFESSNFGLMSTMFMVVPVLVSHEGKDVDDILTRILEIRKLPKEQQAEHASDLVADMTKKTTRSMIEGMQNTHTGLASCGAKDVRE